MTIFLPYRPDGFYNAFFLTCTELISARFLFLRYRGVGKCRDKIVSKTQEESSCRFGFIRSFLRLQYCSILVAARFFREAHFDILRVLNQSEKLLIAFHPCLLCSDLNA